MVILDRYWRLVFQNQKNGNPGKILDFGEWTF